MNCDGCLCRFCAKNCDIKFEYRTPGETYGSCFNCDDCHIYNGHTKVRTLKRFDCSEYQEAIKVTQQKIRNKFYVI